MMNTRRARCTRCGDSYTTRDRRFPFVCLDCRAREALSPVDRSGLVDAYEQVRAESKRKADELWEKLERMTSHERT
jgi:predicted  nucleic acid-binding Zn-ribbon protein